MGFKRGIGAKDKEIGALVVASTLVTAAGIAD